MGKKFSWKHLHVYYFLRLNYPIFHYHLNQLNYARLNNMQWKYYTMYLQRWICLQLIDEVFLKRRLGGLQFQCKCYINSWLWRGHLTKRVLLGFFSILYGLWKLIFHTLILVQKSRMVVEKIFYYLTNYIGNHYNIYNTKYNIVNRFVCESVICVIF